MSVNDGLQCGKWS